MGLKLELLCESGVKRLNLVYTLSFQLFGFVSVNLCASYLRQLIEFNLLMDLCFEIGLFLKGLMNRLVVNL